MKLATWNVNGIRAAERHGFLSWFEKQKADIVCVQEIKAQPEQLGEALLHPLGYHSYWHPARKPGYSGVAIFSKKEPERIQMGMGFAEYDNEGRVLLAEYGDLIIISAYFPNAQPDHARLGYKLAFCDKIEGFCQELRKKGKTLLVCGDFNIAHHEIDIKNPKSNQDSSGFLPEERAWLDRFVAIDYVDTFRHFVKEPDHYTWWSYRPGVRARNIGWRIDYFFTPKECSDRLLMASHQPKVMGSDHCPVILELKK